MKSKLVSDTGSERLILFFAGWAMDCNPFKSLRRPGYDVMVVWDYTTMDFPVVNLDRYSEICVVAWSLGVVAADLIGKVIVDKVTRCIAINGTLKPVDDIIGIPERVFAGTLANLDTRNLSKFYRRICNSKDRYNQFSCNIPQRDLADITAELKAFYPEIIEAPGNLNWDLAIISQADSIFPPENMVKAWKNVPTVLIDQPHFPGIQEILDRFIIDKELTGERFETGQNTYNDVASVQISLAEEMDACIHSMGIENSIANGGRILEIGCGTGTFSKMLNSRFAGKATLELWDIVDNNPIKEDNVVFRCGDAEILLRDYPDCSIDMISSASAVQWFNSQLSFLNQTMRVLKPGAYLVIGTYAPGNLEEIASVTGKRLPLLSINQWQLICPHGLSLVYSQEYSRILEFDSPIAAFRHLKDTGVNSLGRSADNNPGLRKILRTFPLNSDGKYSITYKPLLLVFQKND